MKNDDACATAAARCLRAIENVRADGACMQHTAELAEAAGAFLVERLRVIGYPLAARALQEDIDEAARRGAEAVAAAVAVAESRSTTTGKSN